jgi:hypothetical protein
MRDEHVIGVLLERVIVGVLVHAIDGGSCGWCVVVYVIGV